MTGKQRPLHPRARTTRAQRKRIQKSEGSDRALAAKFHVNVKTVAKWRKRCSTNDASMGPRHAPWFNEAEEALIVVARKFTRLSLERELAALRRVLPGLSRSRLYRCLRKWGVSRIPRRLRMAKPSGPAPAETPPAKGARLRIFLHRFHLGDEPAFLWTCADEVGDWLHASGTYEIDALLAKDFLVELFAVADFPIGSITTGGNFAFCDPKAPEATWHLFPKVCRKRGVVPIVDPALPSEPAPVVAGWADVG
jgi:transposase